MRKAKKSAGWKVFPQAPSDEEQGKDYELGKRNNRSEVAEKLKQVVKKSGIQNNALNLIANIKSGASKWKKYATTRRSTKDLDGGDGIDRRRTGGIGLDAFDQKGFDVTDRTMNKTQQEMIIAHNRNLIEYFAQLKKDDCINLEYVDSLLKYKAKINCTDKHGQTIFHEVARAWHTDVAQYLIDNCADINQGDVFGRTPLHVAAAVDYPEMVSFLIHHGANKEARTLGEEQTPMHYAARNDACESLRALVKCGCEYKDVRDYKGRTPLHVAAELDRSETARILLELNDPAPAGVEDSSGQSAIVWMITKMPLVAKIALDQFHTTDRANRKQYFHLHRLETREPGDDRKVFPQTALQVTAQYRRYDLIVHPVFLHLNQLKWKKFGRLGAWINILVNFAFIMLWTVQGLLVEYDEKHIYNLPEDWWRILLFCFALFFTGWQLKDELSEFFSSRKSHKQWHVWREREIERDLQFAHPRWPEEEAYLKSEITELDKMSPQYFSDLWNIFDWIVYALLLAGVITHLVDVSQHTNTVARLHIRIMAITIILMWLRLMKNARAFSTLGPFIVIVSHMSADIIKFGFLYLEFFIPYACAFWMLFGGNKVEEQYQGTPEAANFTVTVNGYQDPSALLFSLFRLTLVDEYDYDGLKAVDSVMADILVGTWLALSAILMLNLFIALMSDTFQRVYDNAKANAVMQKAITILGTEEGMSHKRREKFREYIHTKCAPDVQFYDDDTTESGGEDLKKVAFQIKDQLENLEESLKDGRIRMGIHGDSDSDEGSSQEQSRVPGVQVVTMRKFKREMNRLRDDMNQIRSNQNDMMTRMKRDMSSIKSMMKKLGASEHPVLEEVAAPLSRSTSWSHRAPPESVDYAAPPPVRDTASFQPPPPPPSPHRLLHSRQPSSLDRMKRFTEQALLESTDDEWEQSEAKRKQEISDLRQRVLGEVITTTPTPEAALDVVDRRVEAVDGTTDEAAIYDVTVTEPHSDSSDVTKTDDTSQH